MSIPSYSNIFMEKRTQQQPQCLLMEAVVKKLYSREDVAVAAVLKNMSWKTYKFLRKKKLLKLPSESTLGEWLKNFTLDTNGLQHNLLDILSAKNLSAADRERGFHLTRWH